MTADKTLFSSFESISPTDIIIGNGEVIHSPGQQWICTCMEIVQSNRSVICANQKVTVILFTCRFLPWLLCPYLLRLLCFGEVASILTFGTAHYTLVSWRIVAGRALADNFCAYVFPKFRGLPCGFYCLDEMLEKAGTREGR